MRLFLEHPLIPRHTPVLFNVPIVGFGASLAKGAMAGAKAKGFLGIFTGGLEATAAGIAAAVLFAFIFALIFKSKTKGRS